MINKSEINKEMLTSEMLLDLEAGLLWDFLREYHEYLSEDTQKIIADKAYGIENYLDHIREID